MKYIKKISTVFCAAALGLMSLTGCEGGDIISVNSPDWLNSRIDSIAAAEAAKVVTVVPTPSTIGALDCTTGYLGAFTDTIKVPDDKTYVNYFTNLSNCGFNFENFLIILRGKDKTTDEAYAILRADNWDNITNFNTTFNKETETGRDWSEWKDAMNGAECVANIKNSNGKADVSIIMTGNNGKTYTQSYSGIPVDKDDLYLVYSVEKAAIIFNDGSAVKDYEPVSMVLNNVPSVVSPDEVLDSVMIKANVNATITFADNMTKTVDYQDLTIMVAPDLQTLGQKYLIASYAKTFNGKAAKAAINTNAGFTYGGEYTLELTTQPTHQTYYINKEFSGLTRPDACKNLAFDPTGLVVSQKVGNVLTTVDNSKLKFTTVPAEVGTHEVTITDQDGKTLTLNVDVKASDVVKSSLAAGTLVGKGDNSTLWTDQVYTDFTKIPVGNTAKVTFINYSNLVANFNNFLAVLRSGTVEQTVLRADNWGWGAGYEASTKSGGQADWVAWLKAMNGAKVTAYITNVGNGTVDAQFVMVGTNNVTYYQYYYGLNNFNPEDVTLGFSVDGSHLKFE